MSRRLSVLAIGLLAFGPSVLAQDGKWPRPAEAETQKALKQVRDLFKPEYQSKEAGRKQDLADKFLAQALEIREAPDAAMKYVLLCEAADLQAQATQGFDRAQASAFRAIEALLAAFEGVKAVEMKWEVLSGLKKNARTPADQARLSGAFMDLVEEALRGDDYKTALASARAAEKIGQALRDTPMAQGAGEVVKRILPLEREYAEAQKARAALDANPADPAANLAWGKFLGVKEDWERAMGFLARGDDPLIAEAAGLELAVTPGKTVEAEASIRIAEKWEAVARKAPAADRERFTLRAVYWYQSTAAVTDSVIARAKAEKKIQELGGPAARPVKVTFHWSCADDADVYVNGRPLRKYEPDFRTRPDEAPQAFSCEGTLGKGDVITVGARRGGSYGILLVAADARGRVVWKTDIENWRVYFPPEGSAVPWHHPSVPRSARGVPAQKAAGWPPQARINERFGGRAESIWHAPESPTCFLFSVVR
jgi:hypothetical protein